MAIRISYCLIGGKSDFGDLFYLCHVKADTILASICS